MVLCNQMIHDPERNNESNEERGKGGLPGVDPIRKPCTSRTLTWRFSEPSLVAAMAQAQALDGAVCSDAVVWVEMAAEMVGETAVEVEMPAEMEMAAEVVGEMAAEMEMEGEVEAFGVGS